MDERKNVYYSLRLKKNTYIEVEQQIWATLNDLNIKPGMSIFLEGAKLTKSKGFKEGNIVGKWKRSYRGIAVEECWFILTNFKTIEQAVETYKKRFGIEEMFRDFKKGGYDLESTKLTGHRLNSLILLISLAYCQATFSGKIIKDKGLAKYVGRVKNNKNQHRHSNFYIGLHGKHWIDSCQSLALESEALMRLSPGKYAYYQRGRRAISQIRSSF